MTQSEWFLRIAASSKYTLIVFNCLQHDSPETFRSSAVLYTRMHEFEDIFQPDELLVEDIPLTWMGYRQTSPRFLRALSELIEILRKRNVEPIVVLAPGQPMVH